MSAVLSDNVMQILLLTVMLLELLLVRWHRQSRRLCWKSLSAGAVVDNFVYALEMLRQAVNLSAAFSGLTSRAISRILMQRQCYGTKNSSDAEGFISAGLSDTIMLRHPNVAAITRCYAGGSVLVITMSVVLWV
jgi:hypothetical protein